MANIRDSAVRDSDREESRGRRSAPAGAETGLALSPDHLATALARSDAGSREAVVARLQAIGGNLEVGRLLQAAAAPAPTTGGSTRTETTVARYPFRATIRRSPSPPRPAAPAGVPSRHDLPAGAERGGEEKQALFEQSGKPEHAEAAKGPPPATPGESPAPGQQPPGPEAPGEGATPAAPPAQSYAPPTGAEPAPGQAPAQAEGAGAPISLPDIHLPHLAVVERCDAVAGAFGYNGSITRGGAAPTGFGVTRSFSSNLTNITIAPLPGVFVVTAVLEHPITYQVRSGTGPDGQVDIASENSSAITAANFATVAADLTPDMSDLNGRPPRTQFWAEDLTVQHELVHAHDDNNNGPAAMLTAMAWLNTQTATVTADVNTLLAAIPGRFASALLAALSTEDGEKHAYGDGVANYTARANAVTAKGGRGEYH